MTGVQTCALPISVNALKFQELQRGVAEDEQVRNFLRNADLSKPEVRAQLSQFGKTGLSYGKLLQEQEKAKLETKELQGKIDKQMLEAHRQRVSDLAFNPSDENVLAHLQDSVLRQEITPDQAKQQWAQVGKMNPAQRKDYFLKMGVNADKRLEQMTLSEFQKQDLGLKRERLDKEFNPEVIAKVEEAKVLGKARAEDVSTQAKDISANRKALKAAGYDIETGKDEISDLIKKSTGSYLGKGADIGGAVFGKSTEGAKALAALETRANAITFGLLNGKLGAGISNADRDFIVAQLGNLASGTTPVETRLAAWTEAKNRMKQLGMVEEPTKSEKPLPKADAKTVTPPAGAMKFLGFEEPAKK